MALYSRKDLCTRLGISQAHISMAVKRGHLMLRGGMIDDSNPTNALYIQKKLDLKGVSSVPAPQVETPHNDDTHTPKYRGSNEQYSLNLTKTKVAIKKTIEEMELVKLKKEKLMGNSIPIESVRTFSILQAEGARIAWENATEDLIVKMSTKMQLSREEIAELKGEVTVIVNKAIARAAEETKKALRRLAIEISEQKGQGEHE